MYYAVFSEKKSTLPNKTIDKYHSISEVGKFNRKLVRKILKGHIYDYYGYSKTVFHVVSTGKLSGHFPGHLIEVSSKEAAFKLKMFYDKIGPDLVYQGIYGDICPRETYKLFQKYQNALISYKSFKCNVESFSYSVSAIDGIKARYQTVGGKDERFIDDLDIVVDNIKEHMKVLEVDLAKLKSDVDDSLKELHNYIINAKID